jgi:hypothetical protein
LSSRNTIAPWRRRPEAFREAHARDARRGTGT